MTCSSHLSIVEKATEELSLARNFSSTTSFSNKRSDSHKHLTGVSQLTASWHDAILKSNRTRALQMWIYYAYSRAYVRMFSIVYQCTFVAILFSLSLFLSHQLKHHSCSDLFICKSFPNIGPVYMYFFEVFCIVSTVL